MKYTPVAIDMVKHLIRARFIDEHNGEGVDKQMRSQDSLRSSVISNSA